MSSVGIKTKHDDRLWKMLERDLDYLDETAIEYGFPFKIYHPDAGVPLPLVALWNDRGTKDKSGQFLIPPRPFLTYASFDAISAMPKLNKPLKQALGKGQQRIDMALKNVGAQLVDIAQDSLTDGDYTALAPKTVAAKGHDTILIESSFMHDNMDFNIIKNFKDW